MLPSPLFMGVRNRRTPVVIIALTLPLGLSSRGSSMLHLIIGSHCKSFTSVDTSFVRHDYDSVPRFSFGDGARITSSSSVLAVLVCMALFVPQCLSLSNSFDSYLRWPPTRQYPRFAISLLGKYLVSMCQFTCSPSARSDDMYTVI